MSRIRFCDIENQIVASKIILWYHKLFSSVANTIL